MSIRLIWACRSADNIQTSLIITSDSVARNVHLNIPGSKLAKSDIWYIPCKVAYPSVPNLSFTIAGRRFGVPIEDLAWKRSEVLQGMCISGVQVRDFGKGIDEMLMSAKGGMPYFTVLGDMFIKNHYVVLSYEHEGQPSVGLGDRIDVSVIL